MVGGHCLDALLDDPAFSSITAIVRKPLSRANEKLRQQLANFEDLTVSPMPEGVVFCTLGTTIKKAGSQAAFRRVDFDYPLRLAELSRKAGATSLAIVTSVDASPTANSFYLRVKGELEDRIAALNFPALHILRPSFLVGERGEQRLGEKLGIGLAKALQFALIRGWSRYRPVEARDVGTAMVRAIHGETPGRHIYHWKDIADLLTNGSHHS